MAERRSTEPEVKTLTEMLAVTPGTIATWEALEEILAPLTRRDRRFQTISRAWVRHVRKWHNRKMVTKRGIGLLVLEEHERITDVMGQVVNIVRKVDHAKTDIDDVQIVDLTPDQCNLSTHVRHGVHTMQRTIHEEKKKITAPPMK